MIVVQICLNFYDNHVKKYGTEGVPKGLINESPTRKWISAHKGNCPMNVYRIETVQKNMMA
jgi:hypothetical protein